MDKTLEVHREGFLFFCKRQKNLQKKELRFSATFWCLQEVSPEEKYVEIPLICGIYFQKVISTDKNWGAVR